MGSAKEKRERLVHLFVHVGFVMFYQRFFSSPLVIFIYSQFFANSLGSFTNPFAPPFIPFGTPLSGEELSGAGCVFLVVEMVPEEVGLLSGEAVLDFFGFFKLCYFK